MKLSLTVTVAGDLGVYSLTGPAEITHKSTVTYDADTLIQTLTKALKHIPWHKLIYKVTGDTKWKSHKLRLSVHTDSAELVEAGAYLQSLDNLPEDLPATTQELWQQLRKYDVLWCRLESEDVRGLLDWARR